MVDIIHRIGIKSSFSQIYKALTTLEGLAGWWTEEVSGEAGHGGKIEFTFRSKEDKILGKMVMEVRELEEPTSVKWRCVDGPPEWIGTDITFRISEGDKQVILIFGHRNWREAVEFTAHCSMKWAVFLLSLRDFIEKGKGRPSPDDIKIDDWN